MNLNVAASLLVVLPLLAVACEARAEDVVPVVSAKSTITALTPGQLADIFLGRTTRLPDGSRAVPIDQQEDSPMREQFYSRFAGKSQAQLKAHWSKIIFTGRGQPPRQVAGGAEARRAIADNPSAIGYLDPRQVDSSVRVLALR
jgi:ABC-type phosphate transport system substrate-binding protein